jgi:hypothetical protein
MEESRQYHHSTSPKRHFDSELVTEQPKRYLPNFEKC